MITLPSHTSHVLEPLVMTYFKPLKMQSKGSEILLLQKKIILNQIRSN
jgi:hypothetical protein